MPVLTTAGPRTAARTGQLLAAAVFAVALVAVNLWPGWAAVPFLTGETSRVLFLLNASLLLRALVELLYLRWDTPSVRALGDLATATVGFALAGRIWRVYPFDFGATAGDVLCRGILLVLMALAVLGIIGAFINLITAQFGRPGSR